MAGRPLWFRLPRAPLRAGSVRQRLEPNGIGWRMSTHSRLRNYTHTTSGQRRSKSMRVGRIWPIWPEVGPTRVELGRSRAKFATIASFWPGVKNCWGNVGQIWRRFGQVLPGIDHKWTYTDQAWHNVAQVRTKFAWSPPNLSRNHRDLADVDRLMVAKFGPDST